MSSQYVLLQFGSDPFNARYEDLEGRSAFTLYVFCNRYPSESRSYRRLIPDHGFLGHW